MKLYDEDWGALMSMFGTVKSLKDARALFEMWLDEKSFEAYKEGWQEACEYYDIEDDYDWEDD